MLPAVSASDIDETVNIDNGEIQVQEFSQNEIIEFVEVDQIDFEEFQLDDIVVKDVIGEDEPAPINHDQTYNDSYIIKGPENLNEIENHQYNNTYIETLINETLSNDKNLDLNNSVIPSFNYIFNDFKEYEIFIYLNFDLNHKIIGFASYLSQFDGIDKFKILAHEDLIYHNDFCNFMTHDVNQNIVMSNDKLHTGFAFSIDNSIVGSAASFKYEILNPNFLNFKLFLLPFFQTFSDFMQVFIDINYYELVFPSKTIE